MNSNLKLILSTFTRQRYRNDCGMACLISIYKYAGIRLPAEELSDEPLSLLELQKMAQRAGLEASCVRMDLDALVQNPWPCILHTINAAGEPHFIIHFPYSVKPGYHLIGDPDRKVEVISQQVLLQKWESGTGLYLEDLKPRKDCTSLLYPWSAFSQFRFIPKILWISIPLLNAAAAFMGLAVSLVVQKATDPGFVQGRHSFFVLLFILLVIISFARCLLNYFRQKLLTNLILSSESRLSRILYVNIYKRIKASVDLKPYPMLVIIADIQRIYQSVALLTGVVLSDGLLIMVMLGALYYYQPLLILVQLLVFIGMFLVIDRYLPLMVIHFDNIQPGLPQRDDHDLVRQQSSPEYNSISNSYKILNHKYSAKARTIAVIANRISFSFDAINALNLLIILYLSLVKLQENLISYQDLLLTILLCYTISLLMSKICNQLFPISQGAELMRKYNSLPGKFTGN